MDNIELLRPLVVPNASKIVLLVLDGLGGLAREPGGQTELEAAKTPNLDELAARSETGLHWPIGPGVTPGSGAAHLALFGYDPITYQIGRGVIEALGEDMDLMPGDVAARCNFATMDTEGRIADRRAGRLPTEINERLLKTLSTIRREGVEFVLKPGRGYRFVLVLRGAGLSDQVSSNDPQTNGLPPHPIRALSPEAGPTADAVSFFVAEANRLLAAQQPANTVLVRGFGKLPRFPTMSEAFGLHPAAIASYPMYRGLAKLIGMQVLPTGGTVAEEIETLRSSFASHDFFYIHIKDTDGAGEDGDFDRKVRAIEAVDAVVPEILALQPDVLVVTGDHSTPAVLKAHSWHPVPLLLHSRHGRVYGPGAFSERACYGGSLHIFRAVELMPMMLANAQRLEKFGA
ncbi:MAG: 2,3-bisphosphoglycerate-independent phosphoglycerate mutase [Bacteroidetes bacterium]|nr:2,3-bisphosphoglycerate-independent phosphoglycerate mutase [Bacteroidota bacterium]MCL5026844.1 2,3-bisphosphoglycerate-independent phosphoglycerate mutase [Chloroflexota bacterium]